MKLFVNTTFVPTIPKAVSHFPIFSSDAGKLLPPARKSICTTVTACVAVHPAQDRPILLSSDRHITRGAQDVESVTIGGDNALSFRVRLVSDHPAVLRFLLPEGWRYAGNDAECRLEADGRILAVRLVSQGSETVSRTIPLVR